MKIMRSLCRNLLFSVFIFLLCGGWGEAQHNKFWAVDPGNSWDYYEGTSDTWITRYEISGIDSTTFPFPTYLATTYKVLDSGLMPAGQEWLTINETGPAASETRVWQMTDYYDEGTQDFSKYTLDSGIIWAKRPMIVGDSWVSATSGRFNGIVPIQVTVNSAVSASESVTVPAGNFKAYRIRHGIRIAGLGPSAVEFTRTFWTVPYLGEVKKQTAEGEIILTASLGAVAMATVFSDVPADYWAYPYIMAIYDGGLTAGCAAGLFCPEDAVRREEMAVFLLRARNEVPADGYCESAAPFSDVAANRWSCKYIKKLVELGITSGYGDGRFGPGDPVTREQMAVFLIKALGEAPAEGYCGTTNPFTDVPYNSWSCKYVKRLVERGVTVGIGQGLFGPGNEVTRAQMAVFLSRAFLTTKAQSLSIGIIGLGESRFTTDQSTVTITGFADADVGIQKVEFVNETANQWGEAVGTTDWSASVNLNQGDNTLKFTAVAMDGSRRTRTTVLTYYPQSSFSGPLEVSESLLYLNEPKDVTFTLAIRSETVLSAKLYATDRNGTVQGEAAICKDDGVLPDEIGKDGIYTARKTLSSPQEGYLCFRVGVAETGGASYFTENKCLWVTSHFTSGDVQKAVELADSAKQIHDQALGAGKSLQEAAEAVVNQLKNHPHMGDIGVSAAGGVGWITAAGILGGYHPTIYDQQNAEAQIAPLGAKGVPRAVLTGVPSLQATDDEENEVGSNKAVIISPYIKHVPPDPNGDFGNNDNYYKSWLPALKGRKSCKLYAAEERINNVNLAWSLEAFKNLSDRGYIHICTHGFPYRNSIWSGWKDAWGGEISAGWGDTALYSGVLLPTKADGSYDITGFENDLKEKRIAIYTNGTVVILPAFIQHYVKNLPNSIVILSACYSMYNKTMADAFRASGAGAVVGFTGLAGTLSNTGPVTKIIIEELYKGKTIQEAVNEAKKTYEYIDIQGKGDLRLSGKLKNAGFENGVLAPWSKMGDGRVLTRLGATKPTEGGFLESYMAIISTGLGYTEDVGAIDQNFCMDADAKYLEFDWNFFSEEFREYCGSSFQDSFNVNMYVFDVTTGAIESQAELFYRKIDDLCGMVGEADVVFDISGEGCEPDSFYDCKVWKTGWQRAKVDISAFADKSVGLKFYASDIGDSIYDSAILIDNIAITK